MPAVYRVSEKSERNQLHQESKQLKISMQTSRMQARLKMVIKFNLQYKVIA